MAQDHSGLDMKSHSHHSSVYAHDSKVGSHHVHGANLAVASSQAQSSMSSSSAFSKVKIKHGVVEPLNDGYVVKTIKIPN